MTDEDLPPGKVTKIEEPPGKIVGAPRPDDDGYVYLEVEVEGVLVKACYNECGFGVVGDNCSIQQGNVAMRVVGRLAEGGALDQMLREAHRMRRAAGKRNTMFDLTRRALVIEAPNRRGVMKVESHDVLYDVVVGSSGCVSEWVDDWEITTEDGRHDACTAGICWVLEHPEEAAALGLDVDLFRLFYE